MRAQGHFPNEQSTMKTLYLFVRSLDPKDTGQTRWITRWKSALNAFALPLRRSHAVSGEPLTTETPLTQR